jgi:HK97 family phage major capsid protein
MELLRDSTPSAERLLRDDMVASLVAAMDAAFIDPANAGVSGVKPASITNGVSGTASAGADAASVRTDAQVAMAAFVAAENSLDTGVWIMSGANALAISLMQNALGQTEFPGMTVMGGTFFGLPVIVSSRAGTNIALVKASDIYFGDEGGIDVAISTEASLEMLDNPTGDSGTPTAAQLVSMFQTNSVAVRAERSLNWMKRRASAVSLITGAEYEV